MTIEDTPAMRWELIVAALAFQHELGADEAIADAPIDRFAAHANAHAAKAAPRAAPQAKQTTDRAVPRGGNDAGSQPQVAMTALDPVEQATALAAAATDLDSLAAAAEGFDAAPAAALRAGATQFVFADGRRGARLMIVGEAPGQDEDRQGKPFVGRAGQLLDRMLAAIGLNRHAEDPKQAAYIANILPWRPPGNRTPTEGEAAAFLPFIERHVALASPDVLLLLGNTPLKALTGQSGGITRARGQWRRHPATGVELMASFHPAYLLRSPGKKREVWADLLEIAERLDLPVQPTGSKQRSGAG
ncbi:MAG: uracil-DNA glycosylase [Pseudomonadota bacterium]